MAQEQLSNELQRLENSWNEDTVKNQEINDTFVTIDEIRHEINQLLESDDVRPQPTLPARDNPLLEFAANIDNFRDETRNGEFCASCTQTEKVTMENVHKLKGSQHIATPGQYFNFYFKTFRCQKNLYAHHFIIKEVLSIYGTVVKMEVIHFTEIDGVKSVYQQIKEYDLRTEDLTIIHYEKPKYKADEIIRRAESQAKRNEKFQTYRLFCNNCEHFATWCVVGEGVSFQVQNLKNGVLDGFMHLTEIGSKISKAIIRIVFFSADELAAGLKMAAPDMVFLGTGIVYLFYCIACTLSYIGKYKKGKMCWSCVKEKLIDLWFKFSIFGTTQIISFVIFNFAIPLLATGVGIPVAIALILVSIGLQIALPRLRKALGCPFKVNRIPISNVEMLQPGNVITFRYYGVRHTCIVSEVDIELDRIRIIHYGKTSLFGKKEIFEQYADFTTKKNVYLLECGNLNVYSNDEVIKRARSRIGETKWRLLSNRSNNFCYWAKFKQHDEDEMESISYSDGDQDANECRALSTPRVSLFIKEKEIFRISDLKIGDVVKSRVIGKFHDTGILSRIKHLNVSNDRPFVMEVITYSFEGIVTIKRCKIDLNTDRLYVHVYNSALCHDMEQRARNARELLGEKGIWWTTQGFIEHCIENN